MSVRNQLKRNGTINIDNLLLDKSYVDYQKSPFFVELFAFLCKFGKILKISPINFFELEQALDSENNKFGLDKSTWTRSGLLKNFYIEILSNFGNINKECNNDKLNLTLFKILKKLKNNNASIFPEILNASDIYDLSSIQKLNVICLLLNEALVLEKNHHLIETFEANDLRIVPFFIDQNDNKFWYFGDTYLFLEVNENNEPKIKTKKRRGSNNNAANTSLFIGDCFHLVCRTSEDWSRLIEAYNLKNETVIVAKLTETLEIVSLLENKRLKEKIKSNTVPRVSSRIQYKIEEKKRQEEMENKRKEEENCQRQIKIKRLLEEKQLSVTEQKQAINQLLGKKSDFKASREERRLAREQQRIKQIEERQKQTNFKQSIQTSVESAQPKNNNKTYKQISQTWPEICNKNGNFKSNKQNHSLYNKYFKISPVKMTVAIDKEKQSNEYIKIKPKNFNSQKNNIPLTSITSNHSNNNFTSYPSSSNETRITLKSGEKVIVVSPNLKTRLSPPVYCLDRNGQLQRIKPARSLFNEKSNQSNEIVYRNHNYSVVPPNPNSSKTILYNNRIKNSFTSISNRQSDPRQVCRQITIPHYQNGYNNCTSANNNQFLKIFNSTSIPIQLNPRINSDHNYATGHSFSNQQQQFKKF